MLDYKDIGIRALKTAIQTFLSVATVNAVVSGDVTGLQTAGVAALAAGISVVWNAVLQWSST